MPSACPKCNFINPWGAEICGECGVNLLLEKETKELFIHLKREKEKVPIIFRIVGYLIGINAVFLVGMAFVPFFLSYKIDFIYPFVGLFLFLGSLGFVVSYGMLYIKQWLFSAYSMWVAIKLFLYVLLWADLWQIIPTQWLESNRMRALFVVLIIEIILIPFIFKRHSRLEMN